MRGLFIRRAAKRTYWVTFDAAGGTASVAAMKTGVDGKLASLPTATRDSYDFSGWFLADGTQVTTETVFTADTTVTAQWAAQTVTITVTFEDSLAKSFCTVAINGQNVGADGAFEVTPGSSIHFRAKGSNSKKAAIVLNGAVVDRSSSYAEYDYTVKAKTPVTIRCEGTAQTSGNRGLIYITEEGT